MLATTTSARRPWIGEVGVFALALLVYQASRALVVGNPATAFENAHSLIGFEKGTGLFVETAIQERMLDHIRLVEALNLFYLSAHWIVTPIFFAWLYRGRKAVSPAVRNAFLVANGIALVAFMLFPVAPPRLAGSQEGFVDTLHQVSDVDLHGGMLSGWFNPYAAVPSMHFGYAALVGVVGFAVLRSRPMRAPAIAYPAVVFLTIVGTANHYVIESAGRVPQMSNCSLAR